MDNRVLHTLEFDKIMHLLAGYAASDVGRELCISTQPSHRLDQVHTLLRQTSEAEGYLACGGQPPVESFEDIRPLLKRIHACLSLSMGELLYVAHCLRVSRQARERLTQRETQGLLKHMASQLSAHRSVEEEIARCILSEDEMADAASHALANVRRQMRIVNERAREKLNNMVKSVSFQKYLQEPIITIRNGRFVLPVKQEHRMQVPGLIHDQSGSGATVFIEPMAVAELGNEYKRLSGLEEEEIARILAELTALCQPYADELCQSIGILGELDRIFAKASFARGMCAKEANISQQGVIRIKVGRHPLIDKDKVVPINLLMGDTINTLIITGPNTGGKTVTLKTIGLFALMTQAGLFIPAEEGSSMKIFGAVYADIGDEQSIEQSLSTFSSHMKNIVHTLENANENALVLLDEVGAGTDPVEGAALAMSILDELHARGCITIATTHYSEIKAFALSRPGMENASMEFDVDKLSPTYRLFIGIPGKSNAFEIAERLGLQPNVVKNARAFLKREDIQFEDVIQQAQAQQKKADEERREALQYRYEMEGLRQKIQEEKNKIESARALLYQKAREEARAVVRESREEMAQLIAGLRKMKNIDNKALEQAIQAARDGIRKKEAELTDPIAQDFSDRASPKQVRAGDTVRVISLGQNAIVLKPADARGEVRIQAGIMKMHVKLTDLRLTEDTHKQEAYSVKFMPDSGGAFSQTLDVRGKLVDEALIEVDRYINDALIYGRTEVQIIHGKGTGALRTGIHAYFKQHPRVKSYRLGNYGEGDAGVTIAEL
ncbi:MAG: endonuclease MutS2 [Clostridiales bacterium]|jgi:DNA mismatch repair protein MutS2|nr:endonuclease MutS2 [Clostridiales bacterium]